MSHEKFMLEEIPKEIKERLDKGEAVPIKEFPQEFKDDLMAKFKSDELSLS